MGSFGTLEIARSGLYASKKALDIVAKNIANANTVGYTRQRLVTTPYAYNMGVDVVDVEQIRLSYIDKQYRNEVATLGEWQIKADALTIMEDFLQEPGDYGISQSVTNFFNSFAEMAKQPEDKEIRSQVRQNALALIDTMHYVYTKMVELQQNHNSEIATTVSLINNYAEEIVQLNDQICRADLGGQTANELRDLRNNIIDKLAELVDISVVENQDGAVSIMIADRHLVDNKELHLLCVQADQANPIEGEEALYSIKWADDPSVDVKITGGKLRGYLDIRDGTGVTESDDPQYMGIPYFVNKLNLLAKTIVKAVNDIHTTGYTMPNVDNGYVSQTGLNFFVPADAEKEVTAKNIYISQEILDNVYNIASSDVPIEDTNKANNAIIKQITDLRDNRNLTITVDGVDYDIGSLEGYSKEIATDLAVVSARSISKVESQQLITQNVINKRASISGVSIDEEMTNLIQYQHAYSAAARVMAVVDATIDTLINAFAI